MGQKWAQKIQLGRESTAGTAVAATTIWRGVGGMLKDNTMVTPVDELIGTVLPTTRNYIGQYGGALSMAATPATYEQLPHIFEAAIKTLGTGSSDGVGSGKIFPYTGPTTSVNTIKTYTIETGDNQQAEEMDYAFVEKFTLSAERGQAVMVSADWIGRAVTNTTFTGALSAPTVYEILSNRSTFYIDAVGGTIGTTQVSSMLLGWELSVTTGWRPKWTLDSESVGGGREFAFHYFDRDSFSAEFTATFEHDATAVAQKALFRAGTPRLMRIQIPGAALTTPGTTYTYRTFRVDMAMHYTEWDVLDSDEGNSIVQVTGRVGYDPTAATGLSFVIVNEASPIP